MTRRGRGAPAAGAFVTLVALAVVVFFLALNGRGQQAAPLSSGTPETCVTSAAPAAAPPVTRQQVLDATKNQPGIALRIDRIESKLTTWREIQSARNACGDYVAALKPDQELWVVAVAGDFVPQLGRGGEHYTWGVDVFDAHTGMQVATFAGMDAWPMFFLALRDRAP